MGVAMAGPVVGLLLSRVGKTLGLMYLRVEVLAAALGLMVMGWEISHTALHSFVLALPAPFPGLYLSPLPMADLWCFLSGLLLLATWMLIRKSGTEARILWALGPMAASIGFFLLAGDGLSLLLGLEFISLSSYLGLVTTRRSRKVWNAGWVLLVLSEMGGLLLVLAMA
jgi:formate hydrogenlyase subunit 3/multisubunit Na+/H+ antiporter MnhD subunit